MPVGAEIIRALGQARQERALGQVELRGGLAEIAPRRHLDAPRPTTEIDRIEIQRQDLRLGEHALEPGCNEDLADLALVGNVISHQQILGYLLGDGRSALRPSGFRQISQERPDHSTLVDAFVLEETLVLRRDEGFPDKLGDIAQRHGDAALIGGGQIGETAIGAVEHHAHPARFQSLELGFVGKIGRRLVVKRDHLADVDERMLHGLVLAKLPICREKVLEPQSVQRFDAPAQGLGIVHRRGDELIDVDVLDVEGLADVRAARPQDLHHFRLVPHWVELSLDGPRLGGHLAERKGSGENLDQDRVHGGRRGKGAVPQGAPAVVNQSL